MGGQQPDIIIHFLLLIVIGVSIVKTGEDLFGKERFAADGLATQKECEELISLARVSNRLPDSICSERRCH